jgi:hypothetical protein
MERSKAESITAYLEARQKERAAPTPPASGGTSLSLLAALAGAPRGTMALAELQQASGMNLGDFLQATKRLADTGFLTVSGPFGSETAQLTRLGSEAADLARAS